MCTGSHCDLPLCNKLLYLNKCSQYCEFHPGHEKAKEWMEKNLSDEVKDLLLVGQFNIGVVFSIFFTLV